MSHQPEEVKLLTEAYTQVYQQEELFEGAFSSRSAPAASAEAAKQAAETHRRAAAAATSADDRRRHRDAAAQYEVTARRMTADHYEFLLGYLISENFASDVESAHSIIENMSEEWMESIFEQNLTEVRGFGRVLMRSIADAARRGMRATPERKLDLKLAQLDRKWDKVERTTGNSRDLENIEQRLHKLNAVKNSRSMQRSRQAVRDITNQYK